MPEKDVDAALTKAKVFFARARKVAGTNNFDYAIDMYLEGLSCAPDQIQDGHMKLRDLAMVRQSREGAKKPSMMEKVKRMRGKTSLEQMLNAEYLFAKDPEHLPYAEAMLKAALAGGYNETAKWIADLLFGANNASEKPSVQIYMLLKDAYVAMSEFNRAMTACQYAAKLKPSDGDLADEVKRLSAELTVARGKYDQEGDFRKSIKNREAQDELHSQQSMVKTQDYRVTAIENAKKEYSQNPDLAKNVFKLANVLADMQKDDSDNEAVEVLEKAYQKSKDFSFAQRAGQIKVQQVKRKIREAKAAVEANVEGEQEKAELLELSAQLNKIELEHYRLCVENYPTDLEVKYEYGICLIRNKQYDDAIPLFQQAQKDPRHKIAALDKIGLCFFKKDWFVDAIDIFSQAIEAHEIKDDSIGKELRYNLARSHEQQGDNEKALEIYRRIAQLDFSYKDVRQRVNKLRQAQEEK